MATGHPLATLVAARRRQAKILARGAWPDVAGDDRNAWRQVCVSIAGGDAALKCMLDADAKLKTLAPNAAHVARLEAGHQRAERSTLALLRACTQEPFPYFPGPQATLDAKALLACFDWGGFAQAVACARLLEVKTLDGYRSGLAQVHAGAELSAAPGQLPTVTEPNAAAFLFDLETALKAYVRAPSPKGLPSPSIRFFLPRDPQPRPELVRCVHRDYFTDLLLTARQTLVRARRCSTEAHRRAAQAGQSLVLRCLHESWPQASGGQGRPMPPLSRADWRRACAYAAGGFRALALFDDHVTPTHASLASACRDLSPERRSDPFTEADRDNLTAVWALARAYGHTRLDFAKHEAWLNAKALLACAYAGGWIGVLRCTLLLPACGDVTLAFRQRQAFLPTPCTGAAPWVARRAIQVGGGADARAVARAQPTARPPAPCDPALQGASTPEPRRVAPLPQRARLGSTPPSGPPPAPSASPAAPMLTPMPVNKRPAPGPDFAEQHPVGDKRLRATAAQAGVFGWVRNWFWRLRGGPSHEA